MAGANLKFKMKFGPLGSSCFTHQFLAGTLQQILSLSSPVQYKLETDEQSVYGITRSFINEYHTRKKGKKMNSTIVDGAAGGREFESPETESSWRLNFNEYRLPESSHHLPPSSNFTSGFRRFFLTPRKQGKVAEYYKKQERLLEGFNEMESMVETECFPGNLTEDEMKQLARSERMAIHASNIANVVLFIAKIYASVESRSLAVIASTLDSLLDLLSGFILWFTSHAMRKPNQYRYPIGKKRMQPVGIIVFASVMATPGLQILMEFCS
ncbi:Metal tolerance protein 10 [Dionaea muscipula]